MIVIYTQDYTIIRNNADAAKDAIISVYGEKLGMEAYSIAKNGRPGTSYRKYGGPLIKVVNKEAAEMIREREKGIGMM